ncbi:MAG: Gfo/Idh/MocA family oxidoreductase [bacterium]
MAAVTAQAMQSAAGAQRLGVAVIGAGHWGPQLARNVAASSDCELRWICDLVEPRAAAASAAHAGARPAQALAAARDDARVEAVVIATPAATHVALARAALSAGRHVLVEKPLALSLADAAELVALARRNDLTLLCDQTYCFAPAAQRLRALLREGELGGLRFFDSVRVNRGRVRPDVDVFWDLAHHDIALLDFLFQPDDGVIAVAARGADPLGVGRACLGQLTMQLRGGASAHVQVSWLHPTKVRTVVVGGAVRTAVWDDLQPSARLRLYESAGSSDVPPANAGALPVLLGGGEALAGVIESFVQIVRGRRPPQGELTAELRVLAVLEAVSTSLASDGATVRVEPPTAGGEG